MNLKNEKIEQSKNEVVENMESNFFYFIYKN